MPRHIPPAVSLLVLGAVLVGGAFQWGLATAASNGAERRRTAVVDAVAHASPSVVSVDAWTSGYRGRGSGAGAIIHPDGYVVTNSHVIHGAQRITVQLFGQRSRHNARLVRDEPGGDLALLKIDGNRRWPYISLASTREVMLGETAIAVGNPHGLGDTITVGVVSARGRPAKLMNGATLRNLIQTDASINTGNSGGPLLNLEGELIGINASILPRAKGIAFAIPADDVRALLGRALRQNAPPPNRVPTPDVSPGPMPAPDASRVATVPPRPSTAAPRVAPTPPRVRNVPPPAAAEPLPEPEPLRPPDLGLIVEDDGRRLIVVRVPARSAAALAGLQTGDILLDVDGMPVEDEVDLVLSLSTSYRGRRYFLTVRRGAITRNLVITAPK